MTDLFPDTLAHAAKPRMVGDDHYIRHVLEQRWDPARPVLGAIGMNPSRAGAERSDQTWGRWKKFAQAWGFGGLLAINPAPWRSADPADVLALLTALAATPASAVSQLRADVAMNLREVETVAAVPAVWLCGWGDKGTAMDRVYPLLVDLIDALELGGARHFLAFGLTAGGAPKHVMARGTSRIPDDAPVYRFDPRARGCFEAAPMPWRAPDA